jgi:hypothetical protein
MANARRGEVEAVLDGQTYVLCLTLGALAELEDAFGASDLTALMGRFATGKLSARDLSEVIAAGLRGGGEDASARDVAAMRCDGGVAGFAAIAARLLEQAFGTAAETKTAETAPNP